MFNIGDSVRHQLTGQIGQVFGYGHEMVEGVYHATLKVQLNDCKRDPDSFVEDASCMWLAVLPTAEVIQFRSPTHAAA